MLTIFLRPPRAKSAIGWLLRRLCLAIASIAAADWLMFGHIGGLSLALFLAVLGVIIACANPLRAHWRALLLAATF